MGARAATTASFIYGDKVIFTRQKQTDGDLISQIFTVYCIVDEETVSLPRLSGEKAQP